MGSIFSAPQSGGPQRNKFDLEEEHFLSCNMGTLVPIYVKEVMPGDHFQVSTACMARCLALVAAPFTEVDMFVENFYCPARLVFKNFPKFITGGPNGEFLDMILPPSFLLGDLNGASALYLKHSSLLDYLGFPTIDTDATYDNAYDAFGANLMPVLVYNKIFDDWYRDQNILQDPVSEQDWFGKDGQYDSTELGLLCGLARRAWGKDYYTTMLPWAQRGNPVQIDVIKPPTDSIVVNAGGVTPQASQTGFVTNPSGVLQSTPFGGDVQIRDVLPSYIIAEDIRIGMYLQAWLEKNARGGARFYEQIYAHFDVITEDSRLQRSEYLSGYKAPMVISEVLQTAPFASADVSESPTANIAGHGLAIGSARWKRFIPEHGYVMTIMSIMPKAVYVNNMPPMWTRLTNSEYPWPLFAHLGERVVRKRELFSDWSVAGLAPTRGEVMGYQSQYSDFKTGFSQAHGQLKQTLAFWSQARIFDPGNPPDLNSDFIYEAPRTDIFAVQSNVDNLVVKVKHRVSARRPLPYFGVPRI